MTIVTSTLQMRSAGVYAIRNLVNNKVYVGSTIQFERRWYCHKNELNKGKHRNSYLQSAWNKNGESSFAFEILEIVDNFADLVKVEQQWIENLKSFKNQLGYNICPIAGTTLGRRLSEETKKKVSLSLKGVSKGHIPSEEEKRKITERNSKTYLVTDPTGVTVLVHGLRKFCKDNNLDYLSMHRVSKEIWRQSKGWFCEVATEAKIVQFNTGNYYRKPHQKPQSYQTKEYVAIAPDGTCYFVDHLPSFCKEYKLQATAMRRIARSRNYHHLSWRCSHPTPELLAHINNGTKADSFEQYRNSLPATVELRPSRKRRS